MITRAHKTRIYPNKKQAVLLSKTAGTARYAYNWALDVCEENYRAEEKLDIYAICRRWTKEKPEWAKEVFSGAVTKSILNLGAAYKSFFQGLSRRPKHHKKGRKDAFYVSNDKSNIRGSSVRIPNGGYVRMAEKLRYEDFRILSYTFSCTAGKWYVSVKVEVADEFRTESDSVVGVDVGIKNWAVASDGTVCETPKQLKHYQRLLKRKQRLLSRKAKGSNRRAKAVQQVQKVYQKITNIKLDTIHKFTATIAKNHGVVVVEDLSIVGMQKSGLKQVRKGIQDSAMSEILRQLMYKCNNYVKVDRFYPSSKTCSNCGNVKTDLTLANRTYHCRSCGFSIDRDLNAALNLRNKGLDILSTEGHSVNARGGRD